MVALAVAGQGMAQTWYSTGFEAPTYTNGSPIGGVDDWFNGSGAGASQSVSTNQAFGGSQSLMFDNTTLSSFYSVRRALPEYGTTPINVSIRLYVEGGTEANRLYGLYLVSGATSTLGGTALGLTIGGDGVVRAGANWSSTYSGPGVFQADPGTFLDRWLTINFQYDPNTQQGMTSISGFSGANSSYSGTFNVTAATVLGLNIGTDYFTSTNRAGRAYFDNLVIGAVPAPGAIALLGVAGLVGARRRRSA